MTFGADFETDTGNSGSIRINCHCPSASVKQRIRGVIKDTRSRNIDPKTYSNGKEAALQNRRIISHRYQRTQKRLPLHYGIDS